MWKNLQTVSIYLYSYLAINPFIYSVFIKSYEYYISDIGLETKDTMMNKTHPPLIRTHTLEKTNSHINKQLMWQSKKRVDSECSHATGNQGSGSKSALGKTKWTSSRMLFNHVLEKKGFAMYVHCDGLQVERTARP